MSSVKFARVKKKRCEIIWETDPLKWCKSLWWRWNTLFCLWRCVSLFFTSTLHFGQISRLRPFFICFFSFFFTSAVHDKFQNLRKVTRKSLLFILDQTRPDQNTRKVWRSWYRWQTALIFNSLIRQRIIIIYGLELIGDVMRFRPPSRQIQLKLVYIIADVLRVNCRCDGRRRYQFLLGWTFTLRQKNRTGTAWIDGCWSNRSAQTPAFMRN